jgi:hypothetical protein
VQAEAHAVRLLPFYVAQRTTVTRVSEVQIPMTGKKGGTDMTKVITAPLSSLAAPAALRRSRPATAAQGVGEAPASGVS